MTTPTTAPTMTRSELANHLHIGVGALRNWEHQGLLNPDTVGEFQNPTAARYTATDIAMAETLTAMTQLRLEIARYRDALRLLPRQLQRRGPGWHGWLSVHIDGLIDVHDTDRALHAALTASPQRTRAAAVIAVAVSA